MHAGGGTDSPDTGTTRLPGRDWPAARRATSMRQVRLRLLIGSVVLALLAAGPAAAGTITVNLALTPGALKLKATPVTVAGAGRISLPVTVADGRGLGSGWTLKIAGAPNVTVVSITARCAARSTCVLPTSAGTPSGTTVLRAAKGTGMGVIDLVVTLSAPTKSALSFTVS